VTQKERRMMRRETSVEEERIVKGEEKGTAREVAESEEEEEGVGMDGSDGEAAEGGKGESELRRSAAGRGDVEWVQHGDHICGGAGGRL
jgi:hypothetical protein